MALGLFVALASGCGGDTRPAGPTPPDVVESYVFDPEPPARIVEGETGRFGVVVIRDGQRLPVVDGVTSSVPNVLRVGLDGDRWSYTGIAAGSAEIRVTHGGSRQLTHAVEVVAPAVSYAFDPAPPRRIDEGDTGHFRVNVTRDGRRSRVTNGVTSSAPSVLRLNLEGDRWRYTGVGPGTAEIRVEQGGSRRLTHRVEVVEPPPPYEIVAVYRFDTNLQTADDLWFVWRAHADATSFRIQVRFLSGGEWLTCSPRRWNLPQVGDEVLAKFRPGLCPPFFRSDRQWSSAVIEPADGRRCRGCGTFQWRELPEW